MTRARGSRTRSAAGPSARPLRAAVIANAVMAVRAYERQVFSESHCGSLPAGSAARDKRGV